jgi:hypothetical protein
MMLHPETNWDIRHIWFSADTQVNDDETFFCNSHPVLPDARAKDGFIDALRVANIVIWEPRIYDIATYEAVSAFAQKPLPQMPFTAQVWFVKGRYQRITSDLCHDLAINDVDSVAAPFVILFSESPDSLITIWPYFSLDNTRRLFIRFVHSGRVSTLETGKFIGTGSVLSFQANSIAGRLFLETKAAKVDEIPSESRIIRHWKRRNISVPTIKTVLLREEERSRRHDNKSDVEQSHPDWTHRWLVKPHWRLQRVGPSLSSVKPTFIGTHVKGPPDKPLIVKDTIFVAKR